MTHPPADSYEAMAQAGEDNDNVVDLGMDELPMEDARTSSTPGFQPGVAQQISGATFNDDGGPKPPRELQDRLRQIMDAPSEKAGLFNKRKKPTEEEIALRKKQCREIYKRWLQSYNEHQAQERRKYLFQSINRTPKTGGMSGFVAIFGENGGCGKSMVSANLAYDLAEIRRERTALVDVNPAYSSLAGRMDVERSTERSLPAMLAEARQHPSRIAHPIRFMDKVAGIDLRVLWGGSDPKVRSGIQQQDIETTAACLNEHFVISVFDTGAGTESPSSRGAVGVCNSLVMVSENAIDALNYVNIGLNTIRGILNERGLGYIPMILVINHTKPDSVYGSEQTAQEVRDAIHRKFQDDFRQIIDIPYDLSLATGGKIHFDRRSPETKQAFMELASAVMDDLAR